MLCIDRQGLFAVRLNHKGAFVKSRIVAVAAACAALSTLAAGAGPAQAQTQTWSVTLGVCGDWEGTWAMQHVGSGHWIGTSVIHVKSHQCTSTPIGTQLTATVDFSTFGDRTWKATDTNTANSSHCQYSGQVNSHNSAAGTYRCGASGVQSNIMINSPVDFYN
jgi:hypothetical protein